MATLRPNCLVTFGEESKHHHNEPERIVWPLPVIGQEGWTRDKVTRGNGTTPTGTNGMLWNRRVTCSIRLWENGTLDSDGNEYPNDNEDPSRGTMRLPDVFANALQTVCGGGYSIGAAGYLERSEGNLGFTYVMDVSFDIAVWRLKTYQTVTILTLACNKEMT